MSQNRKRRGFSLIELMIVIAIILIIATIALPKLNRAKMYAHETAAIKTLSTIHTAQTQYQSQFGRFATSLTELGPPQSGRALTGTDVSTPRQSPCPCFRAARGSCPRAAGLRRSARAAPARTDGAVLPPLCR